MSDNPYESPDTLGEPPAREPRARKFTLIELLVVVGIIGVVVAIFLPSVRTAREPARRMHCANNLKQIAIALYNYEDVYQALPPAYTVDAEGTPLHSWRTLILPYMEQLALYEKIDLSKPWDDPANQVAYETVVEVYQCPSADCPPGHTTYLAVVGPNGCFRPTGPRKLSEITDNRGQTLMVVEAGADRHVHWMAPSDGGEVWILNLGTATQLPHPGGAQTAFADGSVRFLSTQTKAATLRALISIDGNDDNVAREAN
jgi:prepilin-type processing-associated H-X9-DG protein/prepilin-type N-terminal cleavage/methylation domain-containing protein